MSSHVSPFCRELGHKLRWALSSRMTANAGNPVWNWNFKSSLQWKRKQNPVHVIAWHVLTSLATVQYLWMLNVPLAYLFFSCLFSPSFYQSFFSFLSFFFLIKKPYCIEVWLTYRKLHIFNVYISMSLQISIHPWNHHHHNEWWINISIPSKSTFLI